MACSLAILSELIIEGGYLDGDLPQSRINERNITRDARIILRLCNERYRFTCVT